MKRKALKAALLTAVLFALIVASLTAIVLALLAIFQLHVSNPKLAGAIAFGGGLAFVIGSIFKFAWTYIEEGEKP